MAVVSVGETIAGRYRIDRELGRGGMGVVYLAEQVAVARKVAIKVLNDTLARDAEFVSRFVHEAKTLAQLHHPNIVTLHDAAFEDGQAFIVMEYVEAPGLDSLLKQRRLSPDEVCHIGAQVADALDYAHRQGVVHRDVKPSNILVQADGRAVLTDFGVARLASGTRLTQWGASVGTPEYMSPEQIQGGQVDGRSDIYALGVVMYEMLAGRPPFTGETLSVLHQQVYEPLPSPTLPSVPRSLLTAVETCLRKDPAERWQSADQAASALRGGDLRPPDQHRPPAASLPRSSSKLLIPALAAVAAVVLLGTAFALSRGPGQPAKADAQATTGSLPATQRAAPAIGTPATSGLTIPQPAAPTVAPRPTTAPTLTPQPTATPAAKSAVVGDSNFSVSITSSPAQLRVVQLGHIDVKATYLGSSPLPGGIAITFPPDVAVSAPQVDPGGDVKVYNPGDKLFFLPTRDVKPGIGPSVQSWYANGWGPGATHELVVTFIAQSASAPLQAWVRAALDVNKGGAMFPASGPPDQQGFPAIPWMMSIGP